MAITVFQRQNQLAAIIAINQSGAPAIPGARDCQAIIAYLGNALILSGQRHTANVTAKPRDKRCVPPARAAQAKVAFDMGAADGAARRVNKVQGRLKPDCHRTIVSVMNSLTDRAALIRNRRRANRAGKPAVFLHEAARDEIKDRLELVNKTFNDVAIVSGFPDFWQTAFPQATCVADDETLALEPQSFDLVIHAMCLHWANDPVGQMIQVRRALRPDGLFLAAMFGGETLHELRASFAQAESDLYGGLSPRIAPMAEIRDLGALLQRAGFALPVADSLPLNVSYTSSRHLIHDLRAMGENNALANRRRQGAQKRLITRAGDIYKDRFGDDQGRIPATFEIIFLTGWAPDASQPKPLRPGSASARLADALGSTELPLKD